MAVVSLALLAGVLGMPKTARPAEAQVDWCEEIQQETDGLNRGEIDLEDYADGLVFRTTGPCAREDCVGKDAYRNYFEYQVDMNLQMTITSCDVSGDTVAVTYEAVMDSIRAAGVDRVISRGSYTYQDDKIVAVGGEGFDFTDPQTLHYGQYAAARPRPAFEMGPGRDADQSPGMAELPGYPDFVIVFVRIAPGPSGVPQPIHIHEGTCANLGAVGFALRDVDGGVSHTVLRGVSLGELQTGNYAIAVQQSQDEPDVFVACGDIPAAAAEVPPAEPAPATEEAPAIAPAPAAELPSAGSGGLLGEEGSSLPTWWYALAAGGTLLIMGGLAGQWRARRRR